MTRLMTKHSELMGMSGAFWTPRAMIRCGMAVRKTRVVFSNRAPLHILHDLRTQSQKRLSFLTHDVWQLYLPLIAMIDRVIEKDDSRTLEDLVVPPPTGCKPANVSLNDARAFVNEFLPKIEKVMREEDEASSDVKNMPSQRPSLVRSRSSSIEETTTSARVATFDKKDEMKLKVSFLKHRILDAKAGLDAADVLKLLSSSSNESLDCSSETLAPLPGLTLQTYNEWLPMIVALGPMTRAKDMKRTVPSLCLPKPMGQRPDNVTSTSAKEFVSFVQHIVPDVMRREESASKHKSKKITPARVKARIERARDLLLAKTTDAMPRRLRNVYVRVVPEHESKLPFLRFTPGMCVHLTPDTNWMFERARRIRSQLLCGDDSKAKSAGTHPGTEDNEKKDVVEPNLLRPPLLGVVLAVNRGVIDIKIRSDHVAPVWRSYLLSHLDSLETSTTPTFPIEGGWHIEYAPFASFDAVGFIPWYLEHRSTIRSKISSYMEVIGGMTWMCALESCHRRMRRHEIVQHAIVSDDVRDANSIETISMICPGLYRRLMSSQSDILKVRGLLFFFCTRALHDLCERS